MKDFRKLMEIGNETRWHRIHKSIPIGNFRISIQASEHHYCTPRETLPLEQYETVEIAIFEGGKWIQPHTDERFKTFGRLSELLEQYEHGEVAVGAFVPVDLVQDLCNYLETLH